MDDEADLAAERSQAEIRQLLRRLDPQQSSHKDRVRRLNRFRNYVGAKSGQTPDFYDDDLTLLLLGSQAPASYLDEELVGQNLYGLLQACGAPSTEHGDSHLKRSARNAMALLKYLVLDWKEVRDGKAVDSSPDYMNPFTIALCSLSPKDLSFLNLELHLEGDKRGGAKEDACHIIVLVCSRHLADDGITIRHLPLEDLLPSSQARKSLDQWLATNATDEERKAIKAVQASTKSQLQAQPSADVFDDDDEEDEDDDSVDLLEESHDRAVSFDDDVGGRGLDGTTMSPPLKRPSKVKDSKKSKSKKSSGPAIRWDQCALYRTQQQSKKALLEDAGKSPSEQQPLDVDISVRDSQDQGEEERSRAEEEKARLLLRDPLGILSEKQMDLRKIDQLKYEMLVQAVKDIEDDMADIEQELDKHADNMDKDAQDAANQRLASLETQKESFESVLDSITSVGGEESKISDRSVLPTDSNFDPILFLTLAHREADYQTLLDSMNQLNSKTDNQVQQLQNLVRDNFALFVRCADGIDVFNEAGGDGADDRMYSLEGLALVASEQSRKSFKPLLDNTNEVRKVQSALAVLQRVVPILQAPQVMRNHLENGRFSQALKAYRRVLVVDDNCNINILNHVKSLAAEEARCARRDLEERLAGDKISLPKLLEGVRDLSELLELDIPQESNEEKNPSITIGNQVIFVREHPPALSCLLLQAAHFKLLVQKTIDQAEQNAQRIFEGESLAAVQGGADGSAAETQSIAGDASVATKDTKASGKSSSGNKWKYDVLDGRVVATIRAVDVIRTWLPRLLHIGTTAREDERRRSARGSRRRRFAAAGDSFSSPSANDVSKQEQLTAFEVFLSNISPDVTRLVEHATFCALGSTSRTSGAKEVKMSFGENAPDKLRTLLRSPLPPTQSSKCARELANLVQVVGDSSAAANGLRPTEKDYFDFSLSPLDECKQMAEQAVVTVERRRCIFAFDVCARTCAARASGSGRFDGEALLNCLRSLAEELTRPDECASEIEKGCELVVRRCCEGLASYVRDRGDSARLRAVAECADNLAGSLSDVVREVDYMGGNSAGVEEVMEEDVMGLEGAMFDEYLDNVRLNVAGCCRIGWLDMEDSDDATPGGPSTFPAYLSASLLAIVRSRGQVERALEDKVRRSEGISYQYLAMATAADGVVEGICSEVKHRKIKLKVQQADRLANELQFLMNTLKNYLSDEALSIMDSTRRSLCSRAGRGGGIQGDGPDGLAALENLERLGRVYCMCLGETHA